MTWMNIDNLMLSERSHTQRTTKCRIPFIAHQPSRTGKFRQTESRLVVASAQGEENRE